MSTRLESEDFTSRTEAFMSWMQRLPGARVNPKIQITDMRDQHAGRGIVANADIEEDEELFSISQSDILTVQNSTLQQVKPVILERLDAWNALVLCMIHEISQGEDSRWFSYLQVLPKNFDTLIYWSPPELAELEGSAVLQKIGKDEADASFTKFLLPIVQQDPDLFGCFANDFRGPKANIVLLELAHTMATLIMAYGFDLEAESSSSSSDGEEEMGGSSQSAYELNKGMVPLADLFNADGDLNNAHLLQHSASMNMVALKAIAAGQQIFNDFGQLPRSDLLRRYGFITNNYRKWDVVEVGIETITEAANKYNKLTNAEKELRLELAASWGVLEDGYDLIRPPANDAFEFDEAMLLTITALLLSGNEFEEAMETPPEQPPVSVTDTLNVVLKEIIISRQRAYKTTMTEDYDKLEDVNVRGRLRMAIEVRLGEKEILALAADEIEQRLLPDGIEANGERKATHVKRRKY